MATTKSTPAIHAAVRPYRRWASTASRRPVAATASIATTRTVHSDELPNTSNVAAYR